MMAAMRLRPALFAPLACAAALGLSPICAQEVVPVPAAQPEASEEAPATQPDAASAAPSPPAGTFQTAATQWQRWDLAGFLAENGWENWLGLATATVIGIIAGRIAAGVIRWIARGFAARGRPGQAGAIERLARPTALVLLTTGLMLGLGDLKMSAALRDLAGKGVVLLYGSAVFWYLYGLAAVVELALKRVAGRTASVLDEQLLPLIRRSLRFLLVVLAAMFVADAVLGQDVGAWLAGLGLAGLAVSLASQDSLKNFLGSISILLDRPFRVGDRVIIGAYDGAVEDIGFRSTKVRLAGGNLVTIPNALVVSAAVENVGRRPCIRRSLNLVLAHDTPPARVEGAVRIVRDLLASDELRGPIHPVIDGGVQPPRVHFSDIKSEGLNLLVQYAYAPPDDWWGYMDHAQRVNLRIVEALAGAGIEIALPAHSVRVASDPTRQLNVRMRWDAPPASQDQPGPSVPEPDEG
jgi:MscS family membrane protein